MLEDNVEVDVIILLERWRENYPLLLDTLTKSGLKTVGRRAESDEQLLVFVSCPGNLLKVLVQKERETDFLSGLPIPITSAADQNPQYLSPAERIRLVHSFITSAPADGGLGIHPNSPSWDIIHSVFCLHDRDFNEKWIHAWTSNWFSTASIPQEQIRAHFGDAFSLYFMFIQSYTRALAVPATFGAVAWFCGASYSPVYSLLTSVWAIGFVEWWRVEQRRVALRFGVRGAAKVEKARVQNARREGSAWIREIRMLASIPVILGFAVLLAFLMTGIFFLEEFCEHFYTGPGQQYITFAPIIIYAILIPHLITYFQNSAERFTTWENHLHHSTHDASVTLKTFIFTALVAYLSLALTALVYVPFGDAMVNAALQWLSKNSHTFGNFHSSVLPEERMVLRLDRSRLEEQMFAYAVTNQIIDSATEIGWPYLVKIWESLVGLVYQKSPPESTRFFDDDAKFFDDVPTMDSPPASPTSPTTPVLPPIPKSPFSNAFRQLRSFSTTLMSIPSSSESLLSRALHESTLPSTPSNLSTDYSEMVVQFGYIVLWSTIFPLAPLFALLNNVMEIRKDAFRISMHERRPIPLRAESIGAWLNVLDFLGWSSAVINVVLVGLFCPRSQQVDGGKCTFLFDLTGDTGTPIEMISLSLSDAVWDSDDVAAWHELGLTVVLLVLGASQAWVAMRGLIRHIAEKVLWEGSEEVQKWRREERRVKEAFLNGLSVVGVEDGIKGGQVREATLDPDNSTDQDNFFLRNRKKGTRTTEFGVNGEDLEVVNDEVGPQELYLRHSLDSLGGILNLGFWNHDEGLEDLRGNRKDD
ncbi:hypothetical protein D9757_007154 [Collybiopsis confluens]|uniref:DUF590-domain-containing protein n=1 Tax=Collybiopsis confluens TaxID=2823264 RepID=A0A8H5HCI5_9AGAR|nr:hypothetical protein D9757_007154 [Collybiopsis confluens]